MVYTRFGGEVEAVSNVDLDTGFCMVLLPGRGWREVCIADLKADGGLDEIVNEGERNDSREGNQ